MGSFNDYLRLGYQHIVDLNGVDHIIFLVALVATYQPKHWWRLILAATFFTIGHSLSLTVAAFDLVDFNKNIVEFLIPVTIVFTSIYNLSRGGKNPLSKARYWIALLFGLIHGLGFASFYSILTIGNINYWDALLPFNLGVELGLLLIVAAMLVLMIIFLIIVNVKQQFWNLFVSGASFGLGFLMCLKTWPF